MTREERLRRVVKVCRECTRNLAYYRAGQQRQQAKNNFQVTITNNCLDICVLEWCKLFGNKNNPHCWKKFVSDAAEFEIGLLHQIQSGPKDFQNYVNQMKNYRDKWVAHLDSAKIMQPPKLDIAKASTVFYHDYIIKKEAPEHDMDIAQFYIDCEAEAAGAYRMLNQC